MSTNSNLLTAGALAILTSFSSAQTWTRQISDVSSSSRMSLTTHVGGLGLTHFGQQLPGHMELDAHGSVTSAFQLQGFTGTVVLSDSLRQGDDLLLVGSQDHKPWIARVNPVTGITIWDRTTSSQNGHLTSVCRNSLGQFIAAGVADYLIPGTGGGSSQVRSRPYVCAFSSTGGILWRRFFGDSAFAERAKSVVQLAGGGMAIVTEVASQSILDTAYRVVWMSGTGQVQRVRMLTTPVGVISPVMVATNDGGVMVAGLTGARQFVAIRLDSLGGVVWSRAYDTFPGGPSSRKSVRTAVALRQGGFALGLTQPVPDSSGWSDDMAVLSLDEQGDPLWSRNYAEPESHETLWDLVQTPEGGYVIAGNAESGIRLRRSRADGTLDSCPSATFQVFDASSPISVALALAPFDRDTSSLPDYHAAALPITPTITSVCGTACEVVGAGFGTGVAGTGGQVPSLTAVSGACLGWTPELRVANGRGGAIGILGFSLNSAALPIFGGTFYLDPAIFWNIPVTLNGAAGGSGTGEFVLPLEFEFGPSPFPTLYAQGFFLDPAAPSSLSMTGAATLTVQ